MRVLYISWPLLPVTEASAGGAEQVLLALEREIHHRGHETVVAAANGSEIAGTLVPTGEPASAMDQYIQREAEQSQVLLQHLAAQDYDLIHDHSGSFWRLAAKIRQPVLATLHLPRSFYDPALFTNVAENVTFACVSQSQRATFSDIPGVTGVVENGISLERFGAASHLSKPHGNGRVSGQYLLWLGRICEEKGTHVALDVAHVLDMPVIVAGTVYPFLYHQKYFAREIIPRMKRARSKARYISAPSFGEKVNLLRGAVALLIPALAAETSSLVAMEAAACGTPVVALSHGALPEVVIDGETGFLAKDTEEMAAAVRRIDSIDRKRCISVAKRRFSAKKMAADYERLYEQVSVRRSACPRPTRAGQEENSMPIVLPQ